MEREVQITVFADPGGGIVAPTGIIAGPDGAVWFTSIGSDRVGRIDPHAPDPASTIETFDLPPGSKPVAIKPGADDQIWFSLRGADALTSIDPRADDPSTTLTVVAAPDIAAPAAIFPAADGFIWFVNSGSRTIARLDPCATDPAATVQTIAGPPLIDDARAWGADRTGRVWLTVRGVNRLVGFDPHTIEPGADPLVVETPQIDDPDGIWLGGDGAMWFADTGAHAIGRLDPVAAAAGRPSVTTHGAPPLIQEPFDIKAGPNPDELWFTDKAANTLGRFRTNG